jgi:hypothetical protein
VRTKWKSGSEGVLYVLKLCVSLGLIGTTISSRTRKMVRIRTGLRGRGVRLKGAFLVEASPTSLMPTWARIYGVGIIPAMTI